MTVCNPPLHLNEAALLSEMSFIYCRCAMVVCAHPSSVPAIEHEWFEVYLFMPFRLSFPLHFGAKKWQASAAEAAEIKLALIALLVWLDCFVSGNIWCKHRHLSCLVLSMFCRKIIHFSRCVGFIGDTEMGRTCFFFCMCLVYFINDEWRQRSTLWSCFYHSYLSCWK